ncbi:hypothetical protein HU742_018235 [Pseudomonas sp. SWRI102]|uniref:Uncharacterized protein n=1 Tax=Pseudomonas marvdashtae TaxID=2745500 RepID=A0A923FM32_9PSED|nr:hypothetical protein [Pseudomonas marvdashtae]MBV4553087.1 hypothetical protein [Pseudomonas marvdashtae]
MIEPVTDASSGSRRTVDFLIRFSEAVTEIDWIFSVTLATGSSGKSTEDKTMQIMIKSRFAGTVYVQGWTVATGQAQAFVCEEGYDGPCCIVFF